MNVIAYVFRKYGVRKTWLDKYLKSAVSDYTFTINVVNRPKHCFTLNDSTFYHIHLSL